MQANSAFAQTDADRALIEAIKIFARRGRAIREERERRALESPHAEHATAYIDRAASLRGDEGGSE